MVKPGDLSNNIRRTLPAPTALEEDIEEENLPTVQNLPPFERLVLWEDPTDSENKIDHIVLPCHHPAFVGFGYL